MPIYFERAKGAYTNTILKNKQNNIFEKKVFLFRYNLYLKISNL